MHVQESTRGLATAVSRTGRRCASSSMENLRNVKMPAGGGPAAGRLLRLALFGGATVYGLSNSLFNVEGGHRAIVFNRLYGIKDRVSALSPLLRVQTLLRTSSVHAGVPWGTHYDTQCTDTQV